MNESFKHKQIGIIVKIIKPSSFKAQLKDETIIDVTISGKMKVYLDFPIYVGEEVPIEISPYGRSRGRINLRHWKRSKQKP